MKKCAGMVWVGLLLLLVAQHVYAGGKILLVHSYHEGYPWVDSITQGVRKGLEGSGAELEIFYMDTKRKTSPEWKVESGKLAAEKVASYQPDVVITADDNAQAFFAKDYAGKTDPQIVFCGVNAEAKTYGFPAANVTGILERPHFVQTVDMLNQICGGKIQTLAVLSDDGPTSTAMLDFMKKQKCKIKVTAWEQPATFDQWKQTVTRLQDEVDAIAINMYHTVKAKLPKEGEEVQSIDPKEVIQWTLANNSKPTVGFFAFGVEDGLLCGIVESGEEHGFEAAKMAHGIIGGKAAGDYPIKRAEKGSVLLNIVAAEKIGLEIPYELAEATDRVITK